MERTNHSVFCLQYHLILCTKYRKKVFCDSDIVDELKSRILNISQNYKVDVLSQETDEDHIHILFKAPPTIVLSKFVNSIKTGTSKALRNRYSEIKDKLYSGSLWSDSYCLISTGEVTLDRLKKYVETQGK